MKALYIEHSGFLLETEEAYFLFDYDKGELPPLDVEKVLVVFVSHWHGDHYNPRIFKLFTEYPKVRYVIAKGVSFKRWVQEYKEQGLDLMEAVTVAGKNQTLSLSLPYGKVLQITTLKSTDEGVAFLLECAGKKYYHAGDLNLWLWEGESKQYNHNMAKNFYVEMEKIKGMPIDIAFVPLDPRQGNLAFGGLEAFLEYTDCQKVFPMHLWGDYGIIGRFLEAHPEYREQIMVLQHPEQHFFLLTVSQ